MKKYIKPSADVVELVFRNNIAALGNGQSYGGSGAVAGSDDAGVDLFSDPNGLNTSGDDKLEEEDELL